LKGYLDSNVLINYLWWSKAARKPPSKEAGAMASAIEAGEFEPVVSRFCIMEVAGHFRDYEILKLLVRDGFGYRYFSQRKKNYVLPRSTERRLRKLVQVLENDRLFSVVTVERWREKAYTDIEQFVEGYVDLPDAFHLQAASTAGCDYFITGDEELRQRAKAIIEKRTTSLSLEMVTPKEFLGFLGGRGNSGAVSPELAQPSPRQPPGE
jgi:predicted nucleic acid-binding protein